MKVLFCCSRCDNLFFNLWHVPLILFKANDGSHWVPFSFLLVLQCGLWQSSVWAPLLMLVTGCPIFSYLLTSFSSTRLSLSSFIQSLDSSDQDTHGCWGCYIKRFGEEKYISAGANIICWTKVNGSESADAVCRGLCVPPRPLLEAGQHLHIHLMLLSGTKYNPLTL